MNRTVLTVIVTLNILSCTIAQDIDYRQVIFGNSYEQIHEINADQFFKQYPQVKDKKGYLSQWEIANSYVVRWNEKREIIYTDKEKNYTRVYEQNIGTETFYRVLFSNELLTNKKVLDWKNRYIEQYLFYKEKEDSLLFLSGYEFGGPLAHQWGMQPLYSGVEIIQRNDKVIGLMNFTLLYVHMGNEVSIRSGGTYYLWNEILQLSRNEKEKIQNVNLYDNLKGIKIEASKPLIDSRRPFMYTIQNAFDGNPATSYVEDTENDLMNISVSLYNYGNPIRIGVINEYAQNQLTYKSNNRIKEISDISISIYGTQTEYSKEKIVFEDKKTDPQVLDWWGGGFFTVTDIYKGSKYADTCLAELDFYTDEFGWLFGGKNE